MVFPIIKWYAPAAKHLAQGDIDWVNDAIKVMLTTSAYAVNQATHEFRSSVTHELAATGGYVAGGNALTAKTKVANAATKAEWLDAADILFPTLTPSAPFRYGVIYEARGGLASADELLGYVDFLSDLDSAGLDFIISWPTTGVLYTVAV